MDSGNMDVESKSFLYKTGISSWMKTNFERLNTSDNFEAYGSSPPETESYFITRFNKNKLSNIARETSKISTEENKNAMHDHKYDLGLNIHSHQGNQQISPHFLVPKVSNLLHENLTDETSSSTDTTPFVTPQGSPMMLRRNLIDGNSDITKDMLGNNAKKLFYKSYFSDGDVKRVDKLPNRIKSKKKCNVSNFEINAISPTSW
ncbi:uncharacterized protein [Centruroides vittatus]|uniref:uncharacterized protein n=1 Tax=Centruroides vittatus TaxID=120091 RepID=UPI00350E9C00